MEDSPGDHPRSLISENGVAKTVGCQDGSWGAEGASIASVAVIVWQCATPSLGSWHLHKRGRSGGLPRSCMTGPSELL